VSRGRVSKPKHGETRRWTTINLDGGSPASAGLAEDVLNMRVRLILD
jgi:hypothetical protein